MIKIGILLFNDVEVLDFAGPFKVFSLETKNNETLFDVFTISEKKGLIIAKKQFKNRTQLHF